MTVTIATRPTNVVSRVGDSYLILGAELCAGVTADVECKLTVYG